ncbi:MAG: hypothetical protein ACI837_002144 [Crocinitomicaceae bacterium]
MFKRIVIIILACLGLVACRKEILHNASEVTVIEYNISPNFPEILGTWTKVTPNEILDVRTLEVFNNSMYVGGGFESTSGDIKAIAKLDASESFLQVYAGFIAYDGINDLATYNGDLMVGGRYGLYTGVNKISLSRMDLSEVFYHVQFSESISDYILSINYSNSDLLVTGSFAPGASSSVISSNVELLQSYIPVGMAGVNVDIRSSTEHNGDWYICGGNDDLFMWNGSSWLPVTYNNSYWNDHLLSVISFNSELYLLGDFNNAYALKKMNATGVWEDVIEITKAGTTTDYVGFKILDNELYVMSENLQVDGNTPSGVVKFDGADWTTVGVLNAEARDIAKFNTKLYIATNNGIYRYD